MAVHGPKFALRIRPFIADADAMMLQIGDISFAAQGPQQFIDDRLGEKLLGGEQRKSRRQIEAPLMAEDRDRACAGAVALLHARLEHAFHEVVILAHRKSTDSGRILAPGLRL